MSQEIVFIDLVLDVLNGCSFSEAPSETFLELIPKVENPQFVTQLQWSGCAMSLIKQLRR